jgi:hypothetical protein
MLQSNLLVCYIFPFGITLQSNPIIGNTYFVTLNQPIDYLLHNDLWLFYDCPLAYYNGYENEREIEQANFCFGQVVKIISQHESATTIEFTVKK